MGAPVIGITTGGRHEKYVRSRHYRAYFSTPALYVDAVRRAGGLPLLLPPGGDDPYQALPLLDGILLTGGTDVDPSEYGGDRANPHLLPADRERDRFELALSRQIMADRDRPALCICRGLQVLNVAAGGSLYEHIPDIQDTDMHRDESGLWAMQDVRLEAESLMAEVMGGREVHTSSGHHQAVKRVGAGLQVVGVADDGIIEALEMPAHPWLLAVQWHPEVTAGHDASQQALFDAFVEKAGLMRRQPVTA